ncbi:MAG TPA: hypothetical protein PKI03_02625 [Pseudomonadota bacterium]|nr:hypothetical protein [Pseudomonadota bacterium]
MIDLRSCRVALLCGLFLGLSPSAQAQPSPSPKPLPPLAPVNRLVLNNLLVLRLNPVGLEDQIRFGLQHRLSEESDGPLWRDTFLFAGIAPRINPAFIKIGPSVEIQPISIFNLRVGLEYMQLFGTFGFLQSYSSPTDEYDDKRLAACSTRSALDKCMYQTEDGSTVTGSDDVRNTPAAGLHLMIEPQLQVKLGPVLLRDKLAIEYWAMGTRPGSRVFYDVTLDTLVPRRGWVIANDLDVLFITRFRLAAGLRYSVVQALYADSDFRPGEDRSLADNTVQRLGPTLSYTFFDRGYTSFNKPTLLLVMSWFLDHRYRQGQASSAILPGVFVQSPAMPYIVVGFSFQSDLINRVDNRRRP